jgi:signal transduction histidine kinase
MAEPALRLPWRDGGEYSEASETRRRVQAGTVGDGAGNSQDMGSLSATEPSAADLAGVLARVAANPGQTRHLHEILGGYCHQYRNLLNSLKMTLYLARRGVDASVDDAWPGLERRYLLVEWFVDRLQQLCRPLSLNRVRLPLILLIEDRRSSWTETLARRGRRLLLEPPAEDAVGSFDPLWLGQGLDDLVDWRASAGRPGTDLRIRWSFDGGGSNVVIDEPERTGPPTPTRTGTYRELDDAAAGLSALTIPFLTRVMTLHRGTLIAHGPEPWRLCLRWPIDIDAEST